MYWEKSQRKSQRRIGSQEATYNTQGPKHYVVHQQPGLFAKPGDVFPLRNPLRLGKRRENIFHDRRSEEGEEDDAEGGEVVIVPPYAILSRLRVVVR